MRSLTILLLLAALLIVALPLNNLTAGTIHPALLGPSRFILHGDSVDVWVTFTNRGYASPEALRAALRHAEESMLPRTKMRRLKMKPVSLVNETDLPVNAEYARQVLNLGARYRAVSRTINALSVRLPVSSLEEVAGLPFVSEVKPVAKGYRPLPNPDWNLESGPESPQTDEIDLNYGNSFNQLNQIGVVAAHDAGWSGLGVLVGMLDTGFWRLHQALSGQTIVAQWDFINNDPETMNQPGDPTTQHSHGTYTWSTLGGAYSGSLYGPAYQSTFVLGKTEAVNYELPIEEDWYVAGLEWEDSLGVEVISTSLGYLDWYTFADMNGLTAVTTIGVNQAVANGIVCVTAAGNENGSTWNHIIAPSDAFAVITCGAVNSTGTIASFSSHGPSYDGRIKPEVCARGVSTYCATPTSVSSYSSVSGTSLSTPLVGGAVALVLQAHPNWTPIQVRAALMATAGNASSPNNTYGWGIINVMSAINYTFPPNILEQNPHVGPIIVPTDSLVTFNVIVIDSLGGALTYHWKVDEVEIAVGPNSSFSYLWSQPDTSSVECVVVNEYGGSDSTNWTVQVYSPTGVNPSSGNLPLAFALHDAYPNPFNPSTAISYELRAASSVSLKVYDTAGRLITTLVASSQPAGTYQVTFDGTGFAAGVYLVRMEAGEFRAVKKLMLVK